MASPSIRIISIFKDRGKVSDCDFRANIRGEHLETRILIVDDEKMIYSVVARRLAKEGYACVMANNGREVPSQGHPYRGCHS